MTSLLGPTATYTDMTGRIRTMAWNCGYSSNISYNLSQVAAMQDYQGFSRIYQEVVS